MVVVGVLALGEDAVLEHGLAIDGVGACLVEGDGVTVKLLKANGIEVVPASRVDELLK